ncbi:MAG: hypothetical protein OIF57_02160 [Marinobacterium sp.]|nr:hypothetical protein [Marinobacterium sp.]
MTFYDRLTQQKLSIDQLPPLIEEGRYLDIDTDLPLVNNGSGRVSLMGRALQFYPSGGSPEMTDCQQADQQQARLEIAERAVTQISEQIQQGKEPSPLLPAVLLKQDTELSELEKRIKQDFKHLREVDRNPRLDMRYDEQLLPVSRARRQAAGAHRHLAAHSECWQQRTFTGIVPKKIMGRVSEDEFNLYENRLYARLLERLERLLKKRLLDLETLESQLEKAAELGNAQALYFRLREALCGLWGETFDKEQTEKASAQLKNARKELEQQLRNIAQLRRHGLYLKVPRQAQVPAAVRQTNILLHDPHYRHLRTLWNLALKDQHRVMSADEIMQQRQELHQAFTRYTGNLVRRSLQALGAKTVDLPASASGQTRCQWQLPGDRLVNLQRVDDSWLLSTDLQTSGHYQLELVPLISSVPGAMKSRIDDMCWRIPCILAEPPETDSAAAWQPDAEPIALSPWDFRVEESLIQLLQHWLCTPLLAQARNAIKQAPAAFIHQVKEHHAGLFECMESNQLRLLQLPEPTTQQELLQQLSVSPDCKQQLKRVFQAHKALHHCPSCGAGLAISSISKEGLVGACTAACQLRVSVLFKSDEYSAQPLQCEGFSKNEAGRWIV